MSKVNHTDVRSSAIIWRWAAASHPGRGRLGPRPPQMSCNHHHHFRQHLRSTGVVKRKHSELKMLKPHCEPQIAPVGLHDRDVKISILQIQRYHPVSKVKGRRDLGQGEHFNLYFRRKALRQLRPKIERRPPSFFDTRK